MAIVFSLFMLSGIFLYDNYGAKGFRSVLPAWLLLLFVVPLPAGLDNKLVLNLQFLSSGLASWMLDAIGQIHFRQGVVLVTARNQFLTEEACSGVRSLFSSLAAITMLGVYLRYSLWRIGFNFLQTIFWVVVVNAARVALVVYVADMGYESIASGWQHGTLGLLTFFIILLLAVSTNQLLDIVLKLREQSSQREIFDESHGEQEMHALVVNRRAVKRVPQAAVITLVSLFVLMGVLGARIWFANGSRNLPFGQGFSQSSFPAVQQDVLPQQLGGWELVDFEYINRGQNQLLASESFAWTFSNSNIFVTVALDGPWSYWHDLSACYNGLGWAVATDHFYPNEVIGNNAQTISETSGFSRIDMDKVTGEKAVCFFASFDRNSELIVPELPNDFYSVDLLRQRLTTNLNHALGLKSDLASRFDRKMLPISTIQTFCSPGDEFTETEIESIWHLFMNCRKILLKSDRFTREKP